MAIQVINDPNRDIWSSLGASLGTGLGSGFSQGLQSGLDVLAQGKLHRLRKQYDLEFEQQERERRKGVLAPLLGEQVAGLVSNLPEDQQKLALQNLPALMQLMGQQGQPQPDATGMNALMGQGQQGSPIGNAQNVSDLFTTPAEKRAREQLAIQQQLLTEKQSQARAREKAKQGEFALKRHAPLLKKWDEEGPLAQEKLQAIRSMMELDAGALGKAPGFLGGKPIGDRSNLFEAARAILFKGLSPKEAEKLEAEFPSLLDTPKVRKQKLANLEKKFAPQVETYKAIQQVLEENDGIPTLNFNKDIRQQLARNKMDAPKKKDEVIEESDPLSVVRVSPQVPGVSALQDDAFNQEATAQPGMGFDVDTAKFLGSQALTGLGQGLTGLVAAPFNAANLLSRGSAALGLTSGEIPVPEAIKKLEALPEQLVESAGLKVEPRSENEAAAGEVVSDIASFISPGGLLGALGKGAKVLGRGSKVIDTLAKVLKVSPQAAAATAATGGATKWVAKNVAGADEFGQGVAKVGGMLVPLLFGRGAASKQLNNLESEVSSLISKSPGKSLSGMKAVEAGERLSDLFNKIGKMPESLAQEIAPLKNAIENITEINVPELFKVRQGISQIVDNKDVIKALGNELPRAAKAIDDIILQAAKNTPSLEKAYKSYADLSASIKQSSAIHDFANKHLKGRNMGSYAFLSAMGLKTPWGLLGTRAGTSAAGQLEKVLKLSLKSPAFRNAYGAYLNAAIQGNVKALNQTAQRVDKLMSED